MRKLFLFSITSLFSVLVFCTSKTDLYLFRIGLSALCIVSVLERNDCASLSNSLANWHFTILSTIYCLYKFTSDCLACVSCFGDFSGEDEVGVSTGWLFHSERKGISQSIGSQSTNRLFITPSVIQSSFVCQPTDRFTHLKDHQSVIIETQLATQPASWSVSQSDSQLLNRTISQPSSLSVSSQSLS